MSAFTPPADLRMLDNDGWQVLAEPPRVSWRLLGVSQAGIACSVNWR